MTKRRRLILGLVSGLALADVAGAAYLWSVWQARAEQRTGAQGVAAQRVVPHPAMPPGAQARQPLP